jgi:hypothetical protein
MAVTRAANPRSGLHTVSAATYSTSCKQVVSSGWRLHADLMNDAVTCVIDKNIVSGRILSALIGIRAELGCDIPAAIDEFSERYERLRTE